MSDFDNGKDFLDLIDQFFAEWLDDDSRIQKNQDENRVSRIGIENEHRHYYRSGWVIDGIIESGEFGQEMDVIDVESGRSNYVIKRNDAPLKPFYFMFYIPEDKKNAFLILQRVGGDGIFSHLTDTLTKQIQEKIEGEYTLKIRPFTLPEILEQNLNLVGGAKSISIRGRNIDLLNSIGLGVLNTNGATGEIKYTLPRGKRFDITSWLPKLINKEYGENEMPISTSYISLEVKTDKGSTKKISLGSLSTFGTNMILDDDIQLNPKGFPSFQALRKEAYGLLDYINKSLGLLNE
ncbi:MAG: hypothetical protein NC453_18105 [Muribaculum sp.]|nr:hypothetical protein [Muribaculum sp.]